jgi:hypothetical protein
LKNMEANFKDTFIGASTEWKKRMKEVEDKATYYMTKL